MSFVYDPLALSYFILASCCLTVNFCKADTTCLMPEASRLLKRRYDINECDRCLSTPSQKNNSHTVPDWGRWFEYHPSLEKVSPYFPGEAGKLVTRT